MFHIIQNERAMKAVAAVADCSLFPQAEVGNTSQAMNDASSLCFRLACNRGWWNEYAEMQSSPYFIGTKFALIHSEVSEAMEGHRKGTMDSHLPHRKTVEVELADVLIRIFDLAGALDLDLGGAVVEKLAYNMTRHDHAINFRASEGGKKY